MVRNDGWDPNDAGFERRYGDELLCANWNPVIGLLQWSCERTLAVARPAAADVSDEEAAAFLGRIYTHCA